MIKFFRRIRQALSWFLEVHEISPFRGAISIAYEIDKDKRAVRYATGRYIKASISIQTYPVPKGTVYKIVSRSFTNLLSLTGLK